jgi:DNA-binding NarL/FixJ family response regulator
LSAAPATTVVGQAGPGDTAALLGGAAFDVLLLDVPTLDRPEVTAVHPARGSRWRLVVLTALDSDEQADAAIGTGAAGVLARETPPRQVFHAIHTVAAGGNVYAAAVAERLRHGYRRGQYRTPAAAQSLHRLTAREVEVLRLVGAGLPNRDIADRLGIADATVKTHLNRAMSKLEVTSRAQAVVVAYETGLATPHRGRDDEIR